MPEKKSVLGYWNTRAICEPIRLLLHFAGEDFDDVRYEVGPPPYYDKTAWNSVKYSDQLGLAIPNLPYYKDTENAVVLTQTNAILVYIAEKYNLAGKSAREKAYAHMIMEGLRDWMNEFFDITYCDAPWLSDNDPVHVPGTECCLSDPEIAPKYHRLKQEYMSAKLPSHLNLYEHILSPENSLSFSEQPDRGTPESNQPSLPGDGDRWLIGNSLTYVDFILYEYLEQHLLMDPSCLSQHSQLSQFVSRMRSIPQVQTYISSPNFHVQPVHNRYSHLYKV